MKAPMSPDQMLMLKTELVRDFPKYAEALLKVNVREGKRRVPFRLRPAQTWLHMQFQSELKERGFVRALVPKARQLGASTYIGGRYFHQTANQFGTNTYILAHTNESTANVFKLVKSFQEDLSSHQHVINMCPQLSNSNARELVFSQLSSQYRVQSAEGREVGVGTTNQLLHLSEVALYKNSADLSAGLMNTVHLMPGTEIVLESTGRGPSGMFYHLCQQSIQEQNKGLWRMYFMPWSWDPDYIFPNIPEDFEFPQEFVEYGKQHKLTHAQLYWFYLKNLTTASQNGGTSQNIHHITRQEYPIVVMECFEASSPYAFFKSEHQMRARMSKGVPIIGAPRILAIGPALDGDETFLADRQARVIGSRIWQGIRERDQNVQADFIVNLANQHSIDIMVIDVTGLGVGLLSALRMRTRIPIMPVSFSAGALNPMGYVNRRAEMFDLFRMFLEADGWDQASLPNDDLLYAEMAAVEWGPGKMHRNHEKKLQATPKESIKKELKGRSTDRLDCCILSTAVSDATIQQIISNATGNVDG